MQISIIVNVPDDSYLHIDGNNTNPPYGLLNAARFPLAAGDAIELPDLTNMCDDEVCAGRDEWQGRLAQIVAARAIWEYHLAFRLQLVTMTSDSSQSRHKPSSEK